MESQDTLALLTGVPLVVIVPALVEGAKRAGLPVRFAGMAAVVCAAVLLALGDLAVGTTARLEAAVVARWVVGGVVYGLAAAGLYSQRHLATAAEQAPGAPVKIRDTRRADAASTGERWR